MRVFVDGTVRVSYAAWFSTGGGGNVEINVNGATLFIDNSFTTTSTRYSHDVTVKRGDLVSISSVNVISGKVFTSGYLMIQIAADQYATVNL